METAELSQLIYIIRMIAASICGVMIGWERKNRSKEAGVRTHCIVACGSALLMLISKYGFFDLLADGESFDGARIAAQVVSGIGFLGAGMIFVHKNTITGLTTAAGVWTTAGIGMAFGAGMYVVGIASTLIILVIQIVFHKNSKLVSVHKTALLSVYSDGEPHFQKRIYAELSDMDVTVLSTDVSNDPEKKKLHFVLTIELPQELTEEEIILKYENSSIIQNT